MKQDVLGAAVVGLRMGGEHLTAYLRNPKTRVVAICDTGFEILSRKQKESGVSVAVRDYRELLDRKDIDVVSIATPDYDHAEQSIAFMKAGKDVMCEKPMTLNMPEARAIIATVKETGRKFMMGQVCRFAPGFVLAREMITRGDIGELFLAESEYAHSYAHSPGVNNWRKDPRREPFLGGGCHAVDLLRWIAGDVDEAFAYANHSCLKDWPVNDCTVANFKFCSGVIGRAMVSVGCVRPYTMRSVFYGTEGTIVCDNTSPQIQLCSKKNISGKPEFANFPVNIASHNVGAEVEEFVDAVANNKPLTTNEIEGAKTVATCLAAIQSAKTGAPVKIRAIWESSSRDEG